MGISLLLVVVVTYYFFYVNQNHTVERYENEKRSYPTCSDKPYDRKIPQMTSWPTVVTELQDILNDLTDLKKKVDAPVIEDVAGLQSELNTIQKRYDDRYKKNTLITQLNERFWSNQDRYDKEWVDYATWFAQHDFPRRLSEL